MAQALKKVAAMEERGANRATYSILVLDGNILAEAENGSVHEGTFCPRAALNSPSGQEYELCPDHCANSNHSEARVSQGGLEIAQANKLDLTKAELYLAGHWWACEPCWNSIQRAGIGSLRLVEDADERYDEQRRRVLGSRFGAMESPLKVAILGGEESLMSKALERVGIETTHSQKEAEAIILLPGAQWKGEVVSGVVYDYRKARDYREALTLLSQDFEREHQ